MNKAIEWLSRQKCKDCVFFETGKCMHETRAESPACEDFYPVKKVQKEE